MPSNSTADFSDSLFKFTLGNPVIHTPFGKKYAIYADTMASGIIFKPIEYKMSIFMKYYANTHSNAHNGKLMSNLMDQSKDIIRQSLGAGEGDQVIFTSHGASGAIKHLIHLLDIEKVCKKDDIPVVFITEMEHHSNYLPWKHIPVELEIIPVMDNGCPDLDYFENKLKKYSSGKKRDIYASVTAGSNVTGVICYRDEMARIVHKHGGYIFLDCAAIAPYERINMHVDDEDGIYYDALYISPHKFIGGPGSPGLLIARKCLFKNDIPFIPGGGTVKFVCRETQIYNKSLEIRETGGTPNILGVIRAGLAFDLKNSLQDFISLRDKEIIEYVDEKLSKIDDLTILNPTSNKNRIPVYSLKFKNLHYNLVVCILNDMFGIQSRGGVSCCSLLAHKFLGFKPCDKRRVMNSIVTNKGVPKDYGWVRISFHYTMPQHYVEFIVDAIHFIAINGKRISKHYEYSPKDDEWKCTIDKDWNPPYQNIRLKWEHSDESFDHILEPETKYLTENDLRKQFSLE